MSQYNVTIQCYNTMSQYNLTIQCHNTMSQYNVTIQCYLGWAVNYCIYRQSGDIYLTGRGCVPTMTTQSSPLLYVPGWDTDSDERHVPGQGVLHVAYTCKLCEPWYYTYCNIMHSLQHPVVWSFTELSSALWMFPPHTQSVHIILCISATGAHKTVWKMALSSQWKRLSGSNTLLHNTGTSSSSYSTTALSGWPWLPYGFSTIYRVIHKSLRDFRTRLRNNKDRHGRKEHINR